MIKEYVIKLKLFKTKNIDSKFNFTTKVVHENPAYYSNIY